MSARIALLGVLVLLLSGCASYDNGYRDGAYYRSNRGGEGDYYYGRPQQRHRDYYDPFYGPSFYGPYGSPFYSPYGYPYYGPYRPYRSGYGFEYNYGGYGGYSGYSGYSGYGGYGYPIFGLGYTHIGGGHRQRDHDRNDDRNGHRERDRNDHRDRYGGRRDDGDPDRTGGRGDAGVEPVRAGRPGIGSNRVWPERQFREADPYRQSDRYRQAEPSERVGVRDDRRDDPRRVNPGQADFQRGRTAAMRLPSSGSPVVDMRRVAPPPSTRRYGGESRGPAPVVRSQPQPAFREESEESRDESQNRTSALEKEQ